MLNNRGQKPCRVLVKLIVISCHVIGRRLCRLSMTPVYVLPVPSLDPEARENARVIITGE